jgi:hypothetical protein
LEEYQQARALDEDTLTRCREVLGDDHPNTLTSAYNLARDLSALGEHQQAGRLFRDTLSRCQRLLADDAMADDLTTLQAQQRIRQLTQWIQSQDQHVTG